MVANLLSYYRLFPNSAKFAFWILLLLSAWFVIAPWTNGFDARMPDWDFPSAAPSLASGHYFGTDAIGRDLYQRTAAGGRISLVVGLAAAVLALGMGTLYGAIAGFLGGAIGDWMMRFVDLCSTLPFLLVVVFVLTLFTPSLSLLVVLLASYGWLDVARVVRLEASAISARTFMQAATVIGVPAPQRLYRHLLPNLLPFALLSLSLALPNAVLMESFLSFLGVSPASLQGSLGSLLAEGMQDREYAPWTLVIPALVLTGLLYAMQELTEGLRSVLRPL